MHCKLFLMDVRVVLAWGINFKLCGIKGGLVGYVFVLIFQAFNMGIYSFWFFLHCGG